MPPPHDNVDGFSGARIPNRLRVHARLIEVEEDTGAYTIVRKSDGRTFTLDSAFDRAAGIVDGGQQGTDNGARFWEAFKYRSTEKAKTGEWINQENPQAGRSQRSGEAWLLVGGFHPRARCELRGFIEQDAARRSGSPDWEACPNYGLSPLRNLTADLATRDGSVEAKDLPSNGANDIDDLSDTTFTEEAGGRFGYDRI